ncbi:MAG: M48 family metallopeptidase [Dethiobacteria bacterium]
MHITAIWIALGAAALVYMILVLAGMLAYSPGDDPGGRYFSEHFLSRAAAYQRAGLTVSLLRQAISLLFLAAAAFAALRHFQTAPQPPLATAAGYIFAFLLLMQLLNLPFDFYRGYTIEHRFGLSAQTVAGWFADYGKGALISLLLSTAALAGLYFLITRRSEQWWLPAWAVFTLFLVISSYLFPLLIDPLFYRFKPLHDEEMQQQILDMAGRAGIEVEYVLVADASRRTHKANAYFSGLGGSKRIVIYDTLLERFTPREVLAVIAHEIGHWSHRHIVLGIITGSAASFLALYVLHLLLQKMGFHADFRALPLAMLFLALLSFAAAPVENALSRHWEREADRTAFSLTGDGAPFVSLFRKLSLSNLSVAQPHPLLKATLYTHPPTLERIEAALQHAERQEQAP